MSALTKEEMELVSYIEGLAKHDYELGPHDTIVVTSYINRLVARVEELEKESAYSFSRQVADAITKDAAITDYNQQINRLEKNLTALFEAVELVTEECNEQLSWHDEMLKKAGRPSDITVDSAYFVHIRCHIIRNLNNVVQKIGELTGQQVKKLENERAYLNSMVCGMEDEIEKLKTQLSSALAREKALREVIAEIVIKSDDEVARSIARQALEGQSEIVETEPPVVCTYHGYGDCDCAQPPSKTRDVTSEELAREIDDKFQSTPTSKFPKMPLILAAHLLTHFDIRRKG